MQLPVGILSFLAIGIFGCKCDPIKAFSRRSRNNGTYHLAQVVPRGKYRVIIWDSVIDQNDVKDIFCLRYAQEPKKLFFLNEFLQKDLNEWKHCFSHFYTVLTDDEGHFLVKKNDPTVFEGTTFDEYNYKFCLIPFNGSTPIPEYFDANSAAQQIYYRKNWEAVHSLCHFSEGRCLVNYFETANEWKSNATVLMAEWLLDEFYKELAAKGKYFLAANFRHLIDEAKKHENAHTQMTSQDAELLGIFWNFLKESNKDEQLWKRLRLVDDQIAPLIDQFCQIKLSFLLKHNEIRAQLSNLIESVHFCPSWPNARLRAANFVNVAVVLGAFGQWIHSPPPMGAEMRQIVHSWTEQFAIRTANNDNGNCWWDWPTFDLQLFRELGIFFARAKDLFALTLKKFDRIDGIKALLDRICDNIKDSFSPCLRHHGLQPILEQWKASVCANGKFRYLLEPRRSKCDEGSSNSSQNRLRQCNNDNATNCVICMTGTRRFAFDPCGHFCTCKRCAEVIEAKEEPNCPICREKIHKKLRIYNP